MAGMAAALVVACAVAGCAGGASSSSTGGGSVAGSKARVPAAAQPSGDGSSLAFGTATDAQAVKTAEHQPAGNPFPTLIVKTGALTLQLSHDAFDGIVGEANTLAANAGGYVVSSEIAGTSTAQATSCCACRPTASPGWSTTSSTWGTAR